MAQGTEVWHSASAPRRASSNRPAGDRVGAGPFDEATRAACGECRVSPAMGTVALSDPVNVSP